jgi:hypothetical protein
MQRTIVLSALWLVLAPAPWAQAQMDDHFRRQPAEEDGGLAQAFAIDADESGPVAIDQVEQIRQAYGRPRFAVHAQNRSTTTVPSFVVTAFVVGGDGRVKAAQRMSPMKNLRAGQVRRQEFDLRTAVLGLADLLVFAVTDVQPANGSAWTAAEEELHARLRDAADSYRRALARKRSQR